VSPPIPRASRARTSTSHRPAHKEAMAGRRTTLRSARNARDGFAPSAQPTWWRSSTASPTTSKAMTASFGGHTVAQRPASAPPMARLRHGQKIGALSGTTPSRRALAARRWRVAPRMVRHATAASAVLIAHYSMPVATLGLRKRLGPDSCTVLTERRCLRGASRASAGTRIAHVS